MSFASSLAVGSNENQVMLTARRARERYFPTRKNDFPEWLLIFTVLQYADSRCQISKSDLNELLADPSTIEDWEFQEFLNSSIWQARPISIDGDPDIYTGDREFSMEKLTAMVTYLSSRGRRLCRAKLEKLLFYADFTNYHLYAHSISGARYVRHRFGPDFEDFEDKLRTMESSGIVQIRCASTPFESITAIDGATIGRLTMVEIVTIEFVLQKFGSLTMLEMNYFLDRESAYRFTRLDQPIAYEYARLMKDIPKCLM